MPQAFSGHRFIGWRVLKGLSKPMYGTYLREHVITDTAAHSITPEAKRKWAEPVTLCIKNWPEHSLGISAYSKNALTWNPAIATIYCSLTFHILRHLNSSFKANCIVLGGFNHERHHWLGPADIRTRNIWIKSTNATSVSYVSSFSKDCPDGVRGSAWDLLVSVYFLSKAAP